MFDLFLFTICWNLFVSGGRDDHLECLTPVSPSDEVVGGVSNAQQAS